MKSDYYGYDNYSGFDSSMSFKTRVTYQKDKTEISQIKVALCPQYIYYESKLLVFLMLWYIRFLAGWSGAEIKCTVHAALTKRPIN